MIQKARVFPQYEYQTQKYLLDHFHNPYIAKLNIKVTPRPSSSLYFYKFINPLSSQNNIYLSHSLPLFKTEKFRFALIWRQYITNKFARSHVGISLQHKLLESYRVKAQLLTGTTSILNTEFSKYIKNNYELFVGYSGFFEANNLYHSVSLGLRKGLYSLLFTHKMGDQTQFKMGGSRQFYDGINVGVGVSGNLLQPERAELDLSLNQLIDNKSSTSLGIGFNPYYKQIGVKVEYQRFLTKSEKLLINAQYNDKGTTLYLGFKNINFNFVFPFFTTDSSIPFLLGVLGFGLAYLYRKKRPKQQQAIDINSDLGKSQEDRVEELKLISEKAADIYEKEKLIRNGLLIQEAYIGPQDELQRFMRDPNRFILLLRDQESKKKFVDLTVSLRFYVCKSELKLRKGDKSKILGFYRKDISHKLIGIRYSREGVSTMKFFHIDDPITIKRQQ